MKSEMLILGLMSTIRLSVLIGSMPRNCVGPLWKICMELPR